MSHHEKDPANVVRGLKAAIHNPNVSEEAKRRDMVRLQEMGASTTTTDAPAQHTRGAEGGKYNTETYVDADMNRVLAGYKPTIANPRTSENAKAHAEQVL
ncbi:hypothetical protein DFP72DRAFT_1068246 [Ephemerocybe angulata]|uniref:Conidiation-specific protein 6 n=1 Tax=Ephemerocybe angulata TaxID=980116 RepID=A0A8H6HWX7_9AGAR|nr:hypothetical protein DFP72DRAFT_1068246 [Tulosesus angulatus]